MFNMEASSSEDSVETITIDGLVLERASVRGEEALSSLVGNSVTSFLKDHELKLYDAPLEIFDVAGDEFKSGAVVPYFIPVGERLLVISVNARDFELYGEKSVDVDFLKQEDLQKLLNGESKEAFTTESEFGLGSSTLSFLRLSKELIQSISPDCQINIESSSPQRDRIYKKALSDLPNVHFR